MTRARDFAWRFRRILLIVGLIATLPCLAWVLVPGMRFFGLESVGVLGTPASALAVLGREWFGSNHERLAVAANGAAFVGMILLTQWLFLRPRGNWKVRLTERGRPMRTAVIGAAFAAMLITVGALATALEGPDLWESLLDAGDSSELVALVLLLVMAVIWAGWAGVFFVYWRQGDRYTQLGRMIRGLLAGSLLETLIAAPVHAWAMGHRDCYCARGSYTGLVFGIAAVMWVFGPGIVLLFLRERYRRMRLSGSVCLACGYDLRGTVEANRDRCPECGAEIGADGGTEAVDVRNRSDAY